jgi:hypothetical protein
MLYEEDIPLIQRIRYKCIYNIFMMYSRYMGESSLI